ncbi:hypothetical protein [Mycobacterium sp. 1165178.9]|nr:hypothetical protein [Mycobacterium sp. 1165178.9]
MTTAADELEAIRQLKARYCRFRDNGAAALKPRPADTPGSNWLGW